MSKAVKKRAIDDEYFYESSDFSLYHAHLKISDLDKNTTQPFSTKNHTISFIGEIYNTTHLCDIFQIQSNISEIEMLSELYWKLWANFVEYLNGEFAISVYDKIKHKLLLFRDRYGTKPLYYSMKDNQLLFSTELWSFIQETSKLNQKNIYNHMIFGFWISPESLLHWVYSIVPWTYIAYNWVDVQTIKYSHYITSETQEANFMETLENSIIRRIPQYQNSVFVALSWWLDSSIIALFLKKHFDGEIIAYSFQSSQNKEDIEIASYNARKLWFKYHILEIHPDDFDWEHEWLVHLPNLYKVIRSKLPQYKDIKVEFWGDGKEELFQINSNFNIENINSKYDLLYQKWLIWNYTIDRKFLNTSMLDYNLQMIDKMSLRYGIERRMPFLDYELLQFKRYKKHSDDMKEMLLKHWLRYSQKKYAYSDGIWFSYHTKEKEILQNAKSLLEILKSTYL